jgi:threonine dehydratase
MSGQPEGLVTLADVQAAGERVRGVVMETPILRSDVFEASTGLAYLGWKCENLQRTGAFKARGAVNALAALSRSHPSLEVFVTHSSGNHGQAMAYACNLNKKKARVVVPSDAPAPKVAGLRRLNADLTFCTPTQKAREETCAKLLAESGGADRARLLHPYDDPLVIAGQGTIGLEILAQVGGPSAIDAVIVPVGGGGLISGVATAIKGLAPNVKVFGAEPLNADDAARSFHAGSGTATPLAHRPGMPDTIGDGLKAMLSPRTFAHIRTRVDDIITVTEDQMKQAMRLVMDELKVVIEPSAAVGAAVALLPEFRDRLQGCKRVVVILCGGNVDLDKLSSDYISKL